MSELLVLPAHREINERVQWLIRWRWLAALAALVVVLVTNAILDNGLEAVGPLILVVLGIALYNYLLYIHVKRLNRRDVESRYRRFLVVAHVQKVLDLVAFTLLLHFAGGLENPFVFVYIIPIVNASLFFSRKVSLIYVALVILLFGGMVLLEAGGVLTHYNLEDYREPGHYADPIHLLSINLSLLFTLFFTSYFASSIADRLRAQAKELMEANMACQIRATELAEANQACELRSQELMEANLACELRTQELVELNEKLKELDDARMQFTLLVTHELRAPVAAIHSYIKLILDGYVPEERQREILERSEHRAREQLDLIADLLELGKIQQRALVGEVEAVQVGAVLNVVCETVRSWARDKEITIEMTIEPDLATIMAAPNHIKQLWMNLVSNAIKYTERGGQVTATVRQEEGFIVGSVQDTGIGISEKDQERVFQDFFRTDKAKAMEVQGTGLGLSIVKRIVEIYGGQICLRSEIGVGSTFIFSLPIEGKAPEEES
jgi:signal transduction histidine kinase